MHYSHLHLVDGRPLPGVPDHLIAEITDACRKVKAATGCTGFYHELMRGVQYHVGDEPNGGPAADILFQKDRYMPIVVHKTIVAILSVVNKSRAEKDAEIASARRRSTETQYNAQKKLASDLSSELRSRVRFTLGKMENKHSQRVHQVP